MQLTLQGGVLLVWDQRVYEKIYVSIGHFFVNVLLKGVVDNFVWTCTRVYGPNDDNQQGALWEELARVHSRWNMTWCLMGI